MHWNKRQKEVLIQYLFQKLSNSKCVDCGEKDILVLDFDHIKEKEFNIAVLFKKRCAIKTLEKELNKCEVRCANCHRRKTAKEIGSWKYKMINEIGA